jgi:uncharacterized protein YjiS (DUF1127 family)
MTTLTFTSVAAASDLDARGVVRKLVAGATAAVRDAMARAKLRHDYRYMLRECEDHVFGDIGLTRADIRAAYREVGGR